MAFPNYFGRGTTIGQGPPNGLSFAPWIPAGTASGFLRDRPMAAPPEALIIGFEQDTRGDPTTFQKARAALENTVNGAAMITSHPELLDVELGVLTTIIGTVKGLKPQSLIVHQDEPDTDSTLLPSTYNVRAINRVFVGKEFEWRSEIVRGGRVTNRENPDYLGQCERAVKQLYEDFFTRMSDAALDLCLRHYTIGQAMAHLDRSESNSKYERILNLLNLMPRSIVTGKFPTILQNLNNARANRRRPKFNRAVFPKAIALALADADQTPINAPARSSIDATISSTQALAMAFGNTSYISVPGFGRIYAHASRQNYPSNSDAIHRSTYNRRVIDMIAYRVGCDDVDRNTNVWVNNYEARRKEQIPFPGQAYFSEAFGKPGSCINVRDYLELAKHAADAHGDSDKFAEFKERIHKWVISNPRTVSNIASNAYGGGKEEDDKHRATIQKWVDTMGKTNPTLEFDAPPKGHISATWDSNKNVFVASIDGETPMPLLVEKIHKKVLPPMAAAAQAALDALASPDGPEPDPVPAPRPETVDAGTQATPEEKKQAERVIRHATKAVQTNDQPDRTRAVLKEVTGLLKRFDGVKIGVDAGAADRRKMYSDAMTRIGATNTTVGEIKLAMEHVQTTLGDILAHQTKTLDDTAVAVREVAAHLKKLNAANSGAPPPSFPLPEEDAWNKFCTIDMTSEKLSRLEAAGCPPLVARTLFQMVDCDWSSAIFASIHREGDYPGLVAYPAHNPLSDNDREVNTGIAQFTLMSRLMAAGLKPENIAICPDVCPSGTGAEHSGLRIWGMRSRGYGTPDDTEVDGHPRPVHTFLSDGGPARRIVDNVDESGEYCNCLFRFHFGHERSKSNWMSACGKYVPTDDFGYSVRNINLVEDEVTTTFDRVVYHRGGVERFYPEEHVGNHVPVDYENILPSLYFEPSSRWEDAYDHVAPDDQYIDFKRRKSHFPVYAYYGSQKSRIQGVFVSEIDASNQKCGKDPAPDFYDGIHTEVLHGGDFRGVKVIGNTFSSVQKVEISA